MGQESSHELVDEGVPTRTLKDRTIGSVTEYIKSGKVRRIVVLTGAGISTSAGIPDFRSPDTGLYSNLARLDLPYPEAVFDISFFRENPQPFYVLAQELYPGKYKPTVSHAFISLLSRKGLLHMLFTQNIDCLERAAGVPPEKVVEAHGSFASQRCIECRAEYPDEFMKEFVMLGDIPHCEECDGLVKPDITFFGEALPERFHSNNHVPAQADLMIIIGTSLSVQPFASLPDFALEGTPRVLLNMERVGSLGCRPDDVLLLGDCDGQVRRLADELGWRDELEALYKEIGGPAALVEPATPRTKHEALEEEIEKLTTEVAEALKLSNGHKSWLEKHLAQKSEVETPVEAGSLTNNESEKREEIETPPEQLRSKESSSELLPDSNLANERTETKSAVAELGTQDAQAEILVSKESENNASTSSIPVQNEESTAATSLTDSESGAAHPQPPNLESTI